jgi:glycosyltransferase involved in cell wall biosynthesis
MLCPKGFSVLTYLESRIVLTPDKRENRRSHAVQGPVLRIAQIAPLYESVPPRLYGGTERVVSNLTEELVKLGHEVTLFASGDSLTSARLVSPCSSSLRLNAKCVDSLPYHFISLDQVARRAENFDLLHFHTDYFHFPLTRHLQLPNITTLHGRLDIPDLQPLYRCFADAPLVSISDAQRIPLPRANWIATVHHGIPAAFYKPRFVRGDYLAFLGRISPEKRPDRAIEIALRSGMKLKIAAKIDRVDQDYFDFKIKPMLGDPLIEFIGEIGDHEKSDFLGKAYAYLFPIDWPEPFGLTMIEAMACGTPTIAFRCGSVPEIISDRVTGFIVDDVQTAVDRVARIPEIERRACRAVFEERFAVERMTADYVSLYRRILGELDEPELLEYETPPPAILQ